MPKSRKGSTKPAHWPTGFDRDPRRGIFRIRHRGRTESLKTRDEEKALKLFHAIMDIAPADVRAQAYFPSYALDFCDQVVPHLLARRGQREGEPLADDSKAELLRALRHPALHADECPLRVPVELVDAIRVRQFLAYWLKPPKPRMYNSVRNALRAVLRQAVAEGLIARNPITREDVEPQPVRKRRDYMSDDAFAAILTHLPDDWLRVAFSLSYLLAVRPGELLTLLDRDCGEEYIEYTARKTGDRIGIKTDEEIARLVNWLREWKRAQHLVSPTLLCVPAKKRSRSKTGRAYMMNNPRRGQALERDWMTDQWRTAARAAGHEGWTPRDIRPKSLTDEATARGEVVTRKGGQRSESVRYHYVRRQLDVREFNSLRAALPGVFGDDATVVAIGSAKN